jgi:hypothetical protein
MRTSTLFLLSVVLAAPVAAQNPTPPPPAPAAAVQTAAQASATQARAAANAVQADAEDLPAQSANANAPPATVVTAGAPKLVFEREVYSYPGRSRRDPFKPLTSTVGPLFEDLKINIILYSSNPAHSVVLLSDTEKKDYRLRRGDTAGNATVVSIHETRVVFSVNDFGIRRQAVLELKAKREGA